MAAPFPPIYLDSKSTPGIRVMQQRIAALEDDLRRWKQSQTNGANASTSTLALLSGKVQDLQLLTADLETQQNGLKATQAALTTTTNRLQAATDLLAAYAQLQYKEWSSTSGVSPGVVGYASTPATVSITSATGRIEVGFGGSLNSGNGYFVYGVSGASSGTIVARETVRSNLAQRVAVTGGASFIGSAFNSLVVSVPKNEALTVSVEMYSASTTTYFYGAKIQARVAP